MSNFYSTINVLDNLYTGTVYDSVTNQAVYRTPAYTNQDLASNDVNSFLESKNNNIQASTITIQPKKRCCGR